MTGEIPQHAVVVAGKHQFSCPLGNTIILLDTKPGLYFSLENVGAAVWQLLQRPTTVAEVYDSILDEFDVPPDVCRRDVLALLRELSDRNLIEIRDGAVG